MTKPPTGNITLEAVERIMRKSGAFGEEVYTRLIDNPPIFKEDGVLGKLYQWRSKAALDLDHLHLAGHTLDLRLTRYERAGANGFHVEGRTNFSGVGELEERLSPMQKVAMLIARDNGVIFNYKLDGKGVLIYQTEGPVLGYENLENGLKGVLVAQKELSHVLQAEEKRLYDTRLNGDGKR